MSEILVTKEGAMQLDNLISETYDKINKNNIEKSEAMNDAPGDGWHDNFAAEDAARVEKMLMGQLNKLLLDKKNLKIINEKKIKENVNINDYIYLQFIYENGMHEDEKIKLTGLYKPNNEEEITLNSIVGKTIYNKKINTVHSYYVNDLEIKIQILKKEGV